MDWRSTALLMMKKLSLGALSVETCEASYVADCRYFGHGWLDAKSYQAKTWVSQNVGMAFFFGKT